jgi:hypothetical protein
MAQLVSATATQAASPLQGGYPQVITIVQEFDRPVVISEDFQLVFYGKYPESELNQQRGEMVGKPFQTSLNQLTYTFQISPFARGDLGVLKKIGQISDIYGGPVDLKIGDDFSIYNTRLSAFFGNVRVTPDWSGNQPWPTTAACPDNQAPKTGLVIGPWPNSLLIPDGLWNGGNFYYWMNITFKPDREAEGIPFVWEPPFYYAYSGFGFPLSGTRTPLLPPWPLVPPGQSVLYNICSSGEPSQGVYDTCGWITDFPRWKGRVQFWCFGSDIFADGNVPWDFPAIAAPTGDLSPYAIFGFPQNAQEQFFKQVNFSYVNP